MDGVGAINRSRRGAWWRQFVGAGYRSTWAPRLLWSTPDECVCSPNGEPAGSTALHNPSRIR